MPELRKLSLKSSASLRHLRHHYLANSRFSVALTTKLKRCDAGAMAGRAPTQRASTTSKQTTTSRAKTTETRECSLVARFVCDSLVNARRLARKQSSHR